MHQLKLSDDHSRVSPIIRLRALVSESRALHIPCGTTTVSNVLGAHANSYLAQVIARAGRHHRWLIIACYLPSLLWCCWFGGGNGIRTVKKTKRCDAGVVICLGRDADLHIRSWFHCHSLSLASVNADWFYLPVFAFLVPAHPRKSRTQSVGP